MDNTKTLKKLGNKACLCALGGGVLIMISLHIRVFSFAVLGAILCGVAQIYADKYTDTQNKKN